MNRIQEHIRRFLIGRYGNDELSRFLSIAAFVLAVVSLFTKWQWLFSVAFALMLWSTFRILSKNHTGRAKERTAFLRWRQRILHPLGKTKRRIEQSRTHRFFRCPDCDTEVRVPKGKGKIRITCTQCGHKFVKRS